MGNVHLTCLERWLNMSGRDYCELCLHHFNAQQTRRYGVWQSLRVWARHPRHSIHIRSDLVIAMVLTVLTSGLCTICFTGMKYFVLEGLRIGISALWTQGVMTLFLAFVIVGYLITVYLMIMDHLRPWYHWWTHAVNVHLLLDMELPELTLHQRQESVVIPTIRVSPSRLETTV